MPMFGYLDARAMERSRPDYLVQLADYARLEFPQEDPVTVSHQALASLELPREPVRRRFWPFRAAKVPTGPVRNV